MQSRNEFIKKEIEKCNPAIRMAVEVYCKSALDSGSRICNDGYPDARFLCTFKHPLARRVIDRLRTEYNAQLFTVTVVNNYSLFGSK